MMLLRFKGVMEELNWNLMNEAFMFAYDNNQISDGTINRFFKCGYKKSNDILNFLASNGIVSSSQHGKREIMISKEEWEKFYNERKNNY